MNQTHTRDRFREYLDEILPTVDRYLSEKQTPIHQRPFRAADAVVRVYIVQVKGSDKKDYLHRPWFKAIYRLVEAWYQARYGAALESRTQGEVWLPESGTEYISVIRTA